MAPLLLFSPGRLPVPVGMPSMEGHCHLAVPVSRHGLRLGDVDNHGRRVVQICPNPECRRDRHRARSHCWHCWAALPRPMVLEVVADGADRGVAAGEPADEVEPDPEQEEEGHVDVHLARWIWMAGGPCTAAAHRGPHTADGHAAATGGMTGGRMCAHLMLRAY